MLCCCMEKYWIHQGVHYSNFRIFKRHENQLHTHINGQSSSICVPLNSIHDERTLQIRTLVQISDDKMNEEAALI